MLHTKFRFILQSGFKKEDLTNQKQELPATSMFLTNCEMSNLDRGPSKDASYQISVHLGKRMQRRRFF
jgi:hypothetical protein